MTAPLVVLCMVGGDERIVAELVAAGQLPAFAALRRRGAAVSFATAGAHLEDCIWPPLLSGQPPGNYATAHFHEFVPEAMGLTVRRENTTEVEPYWLHLPGRGKDTLAIDAPEMHPNPASNADEACCWHTVGAPHRLVSSSPSLAKALKALQPSNALVEPTGPVPTGEARATAQSFTDDIGLRARALASLYRGRPSVVAGFHEPHAVMHWFGHHHDRDHWLHPADPEPDLVAGPYRALDRAVGQLVGGRKEANVVVVLAGGPRAAGLGGDLLTGLLERAQLLTRRRTGVRSQGAGHERAWLTHSARTLLPADLRERLATRLLPPNAQHRLASRRFRDEHVWERTKVFPAPAWSHGMLRANVIGRETAGVVPPEELDNLLGQTTRLVLETRDAETDRPVAREVIRAQRLYPGRLASRLPDLIVVWQDGPAPKRARHPALGEWPVSPGYPRITGHRSNGQALLAGPGVRALDNTIDDDPLGLAPTLLALLDARPPSVMPGHSWGDVLVR